MSDAEREVLFDHMSDGAAKVMMAITLLPVDGEERDDLIERQSAIICQIAAALGYGHSRIFDDFVIEGQAIADKLRGQYERLMR